MEHFLQSLLIALVGAALGIGVMAVLALAWAIALVASGGLTALTDKSEALTADRAERDAEYEAGNFCTNWRHPREGFFYNPAGCHQWVPADTVPLAAKLTHNAVALATAPVVWAVVAATLYVVLAVR